MIAKVALFAAFVGTVIAANWAVNRYGIVEVGFGLEAPAGVYFAGLAFGIRDALHETAGRYWVFGAILVGAVASLIVGDAVTIPGGLVPLAVASGVAFTASELADLAVYEPLRERQWTMAVVASNIVGAVADSMLFLWLAFGSLSNLAGQVVAKSYMIAIAIPLVWLARGTSTDKNMNFYLGTHEVDWLSKVDVPLFVSHQRLRKRRRLPRARCFWALDSGAFSDIAQHGEFTTTPAEYVAAVRRYRDEVGGLDWAAPQDHMTEPWVIRRSKIARTVTKAQQYTIDNYLELRSLDDTLPIIPVIQGQTLADYEAHVRAYDRAGIDLTYESIVGLGSVCRRQATPEITELIDELATELSLHGFGVKTAGMKLYGPLLTSADSMAWSYRGRRIRPCPQRPELASCSNCQHHALTWRERVLTMDWS